MVQMFGWLSAEAARASRWETFQSGGVRIEFGRKNLQRYVTTQRFVLGFIDNAHPTPTKLRDDAVVRDGLTEHGQACYGGSPTKSTKSRQLEVS